MSEHAMLIRCVYCGTDKPPVKNESELKDFEPWRCSECGESGVREDFFILEAVTLPSNLGDRETPITLMELAFKKGKIEGIGEGRQMEREAVSRYFRKAGKPYYAAFFKEGEHLK